MKSVTFNSGLNALSLITLFMSSMSWAATVLSPSDLIKLESLSVKCSEPGIQCPKLPTENVLDVVHLKIDDKYELEDKTFRFVTEEGLLVSFIKNLQPKDEINSVENMNPEEIVDDLKENEVENLIEHRFFPFSKIQLSPDNDFYLCDIGKEFTLDINTDFSTLGISEEQATNIFTSGYEPMSFKCKCFWVPKYVFEKLGIEKYDTKDSEMEIFDTLVPESKSIPNNTLNKNNLSDKPSTFGIYWFPNYPRSTFNPVDPNVPNDPKDPYDPSYPSPPPDREPSPVGSPCGILQFGCMFGYFFK